MPRFGGWEQSEFGASLTRIRESKGITQKALGELTGVHPNTIAKLERGEHEPSWPLVLAFTKALGVDCSAFGGLVEGLAAERAPAEKKGRGRPKKAELAAAELPAAPKSAKGKPAKKLKK